MHFIEYLHTFLPSLSFAVISRYNLTQSSIMASISHYAHNWSFHAVAAAYGLAATPMIYCFRCLMVASNGQVNNAMYVYRP
jgi:hypothetical protein